jgi:hypothetical protein
VKIALLLISSTTYGQEAVITTGGNSEGTGGSISYSVGQVVYTSTSGSNGSIGQGIQQPYEIYTVVGFELSEIDLLFNVYPNPTKDMINLRVKYYNHEELSYQLYNMDGKLLEHRQVIKKNTPIDMSNLNNNTFRLNVLKENVLIKSFNIVKN